MAPRRSLLRGTTVYLSGPMDFVASRAEERRNGWRTRVRMVLESWGVRVFDPWFKPIVRNLGRYGIEDETTTQARASWRFDDGLVGATARSALSGSFWPVMHVDLRMVDLSDFIIACCPTNLYSVGTPHEIVVARQQRKPVLLVSPPCVIPLGGRFRPGPWAIGSSLPSRPRSSARWSQLRTSTARRASGI